MESTTNSSSSDNNSYKNNMSVENIVINVVLGLVAIIVLIYTILIIKYRFFNRNVLQEDNKPINSVQRIPNPLYKIDSENDININIDNNTNNSITNNNLNDSYSKKDIHYEVIHDINNLSIV